MFLPFGALRPAPASAGLIDLNYGAVGYVRVDLVSNAGATGAELDRKITHRLHSTHCRA
jgi:hypothetical protein